MLSSPLFVFYYSLILLYSRIKGETCYEFISEFAAFKNYLCLLALACYYFIFLLFKKYIIYKELL